MVRVLGAMAAGVAVALAAAGAWADGVIRGPLSFTGADTVRIERLVGNLKVVPLLAGPVEVLIQGPEDEVAQIAVEQLGDAVVLRQPPGNWSFFRLWQDRVQVTLRMPQRTGLAVAGLVGDAEIGDTRGTVALEVTDGRVRIGEVARVKLKSVGSADVSVAAVAGMLEAEMQGSGELECGPVGEAAIAMMGSGEVDVGPVAGALRLTVSGSGKAEFAAVAGPVRVDVMGSGTVEIEGGTAQPLVASIAGSGRFRLDGEAAGADVTVAGSGSARVRRVSGEVRSHRSGSGSIQLGDREG